MNEKLLNRFIHRTHKHRQRVIKNAQIIESAFPKLGGLKEQCLDHDVSKFHSPEKDPYIWLTEYYRCKYNNIPFMYPRGIEDQINSATCHHIINNPHHPEYWSPDKNNIKIGDNRDGWKQPTEIVVASKMPKMNIGEMISDWAAMSQEKNSSLIDWANKNINKRWKFSPEQEELIWDLIGLFEK